ncbi:isoliquiritigenin 2'-O-methyltransferase-like [Quercus robur]|uniref:isoliquiritigenin 2'-O-methyltransferase-like n=1 Tax=Quercus robur TaxID=38942 RepID=UPI002161A07E|nr:isoliquiritigenin 2'-O-methyltransferase-like [Quercus robur]
MSSTQNQCGKPPISKEDDDPCLYALLQSSSHVFPMVLNAAIELNLFEIIAKASPDAFLSPSEIASKLPTQNPDAPYMLDRMLRLLASYSLLTCSMRTCEDGRIERLYGVSPAGKFYVQNEDGGSVDSISAFALHRATVEVLLNFKTAILEGGNLFEKVHGKSIFQYMKADASLNNLFNKAMADLSGIHMKKILEKYEGFEGVSLLVDVAGGTGASLNMVISKYPSIKGINFDLPQVIQHAPSYPGIEHVGGDMYISVPKGDVIMIKGTCHNWNDEQCIKLLKNCKKAVPIDGKVIIMDFVLPEEPEASNASKYVSMLDNAMFIQPGGKERTEKEFEALSKAAGFSGFQVICRAFTVMGVMELYK